MATKSTEPAATAGSGEAATAAEETSTTPATGTGTPGTGEATEDGGSGTPQLTPEQIQQLIESNERMQRALQEANGEAQRRREQAKEAERQKMTAEEAAKAELEELRGAAEEWEVERASLYLENEVSRISLKLGIIDPDVVTRLIDWEDLEFDEGRPVNVEEVVTAIVREKSYLVGKQGQAQGRSTGIGAGHGQGGAPAVNLTAQELQAAQTAGMSPERYSSLKNVSTLDQWLATKKTGQGN